MGLPLTTARYLLLSCVAFVLWNLIMTAPSTSEIKSIEALEEGSRSQEVAKNLGKAALGWGERARPTHEQLSGPLGSDGRPHSPSMASGKSPRPNYMTTNLGILAENQWQSPSLWEKWRKKFNFCYPLHTILNEHGVDIHALASDSPSLKYLMKAYPVPVKEGQMLKMKSLKTWMKKVSQVIRYRPDVKVSLYKEAQVQLGLAELEEKLEEKVKMKLEVFKVRSRLTDKLKDRVQAIHDDARIWSAQRIQKSHLVDDEKKNMLTLGKMVQDAPEGMGPEKVEATAEGLAKLELLRSWAENGAGGKGEKTKLAALSLLSLVAKPFDQDGTSIFPDVEAWKKYAQTVLTELALQVIHSAETIEPVQRVILSTPSKYDYLLISKYIENVEHNLGRAQILNIRAVSKHGLAV